MNSSRDDEIKWCTKEQRERWNQQFKDRLKFVLGDWNALTEAFNQRESISIKKLNKDFNPTKRSKKNDFNQDELLNTLIQINKLNKNLQDLINEGIIDQRVTYLRSIGFSDEELFINMTPVEVLICDAAINCAEAHILKDDPETQQFSEFNTCYMTAALNCSNDEETVKVNLQAKEIRKSISAHAKPIFESYKADVNTKLNEAKQRIEDELKVEEIQDAEEIQGIGILEEDVDHLMDWENLDFNNKQKIEAWIENLIKDFQIEKLKKGKENLTINEYSQLRVENLRGIEKLSNEEVFKYICWASILGNEIEIEETRKKLLRKAAKEQGKGLDGKMDKKIEYEERRKHSSFAIVNYLKYELTCRLGKISSDWAKKTAIVQYQDYVNSEKDDDNYIQNKIDKLGKIIINNFTLIFELINNSNENDFDTFFELFWACANLDVAINSENKSQLLRKAGEEILRIVREENLKDQNIKIEEVPIFTNFINSTANIINNSNFTSSDNNLDDKSLDTIINLILACAKLEEAINNTVRNNKNFKSLQNVENNIKIIRQNIENNNIKIEDMPILINFVNSTANVINNSKSASNESSNLDVKSLDNIIKLLLARAKLEVATTNKNNSELLRNAGEKILKVTQQDIHENNIKIDDMPILTDFINATADEINRTADRTAGNNNLVNENPNASNEDEPILNPGQNDKVYVENDETYAMKVGNLFGIGSKLTEKAAGALMILLGVSLITASTAAFFFSFGASAPVSAVGLALGAAAIAGTTVGTGMLLGGVGFTLWANKGAIGEVAQQFQEVREMHKQNHSL